MFEDGLVLVPIGKVFGLHSLHFLFSVVGGVSDPLEHAFSQAEPVFGLALVLRFDLALAVRLGYFRVGRVVCSGLEFLLVSVVLRGNCVLFDRFAS